MKKNLKKLSSLALAFVLVLALSVTALAADISSDRAKTIALADAGFSQTEVSYLAVKSEYDDGVKIFDVSFVAFNSDGSFTEYDYEIKAANGTILGRDIDIERGKSQQVPINGSNDIGAEQAKRIALEHFGVKAEEVKFLQVKRDYDDGRVAYEIEFCQPYTLRYSCEISASNGLLRDAERETVRGIFDKIELFFEVLIATILGI